MLIEITQGQSGRYMWMLHDGPDGIDEVTGSTESLQEAFNRILKARERIAASYTEAAPAPTPRDYSTYPNGTIFRLRNGDTATKTSTASAGTYPVLAEHKFLHGTDLLHRRSWTSDGRYIINDSEHPFDIIGVAFNPEANIPATSDTTTDPSPMAIDLSTHALGTIFRARSGKLMRLESNTQGTPKRPYTLCEVEGSACGIYPQDGVFGDDPAVTHECDLIEVVATKAPKQPEAEPGTDPVDYSTYPNGTVFTLRNGEVATKVGLNRSFRYPVLCQHQGLVRSWTADGRFSIDGHQDSLDIVGIAWNPEADTPADPDETLQQLETQEEPTSPEDAPAPLDPWHSRSARMRCSTCMWFVEKNGEIGRCRRHAPTMGGFPVVTVADWCGEHRLDKWSVA